jgi:hypothetical protein
LDNEDPVLLIAHPNEMTYRKTRETTVIPKNCEVTKWSQKKRTGRRVWLELTIADVNLAARQGDTEKLGTWCKINQLQRGKLSARGAEMTEFASENLRNFISSKEYIPSLAVQRELNWEAEKIELCKAYATAGEDMDREWRHFVSTNSESFRTADNLYARINVLKVKDSERQGEAETVTVAEFIMLVTKWDPTESTFVMEDCW